MRYPLAKELKRDISLIIIKMLNKLDKLDVIVKLIRKARTETEMR